MLGSYDLLFLLQNTSVKGLHPALVTLSIRRLIEPQRKVKQNYQPSSKNWCFESTKYRFISIS